MKKLLIILILLVGFTVYAAITLDQHENDSDVTFNDQMGTDNMWQDFHSGVTDVLDHVILKICNNGSITSATVNIYGGNGSGVPTGGSLASATVLGTSIPACTSHGWVTFTFSSPPSLTSGSEYVIVLNHSGGTNVGWKVAYNTGNYGSGRCCENSGAGCYGASDAAFETWMGSVPPPPPPSQESDLILFQ